MTGQRASQLSRGLSSHDQIAIGGDQGPESAFVLEYPRFGSPK